MFALAACEAAAPDALGVTDGTLAPCPETPNCVHTGLLHPTGTQPLFLRSELPPSDVMSRLRRVVSELPRGTVLTASDGYLHAEVRSRLFRFIDDIELLVADDGELVVRSASRVGRSDFGVNARRVDWLRRALGDAGLLR